MSEFWAPASVQAAKKINAWTATAAQPHHFTPWSSDSMPMRRRSDHISIDDEPAQPDAEQIEAMRAEAFAAGFEQGRTTADTEFADERAALTRLAASLEVLQPEAHGPLATLLAETVTRLVRQIVGEVEINAKTLQERAEAIAELVIEEAGPCRMRLHPDDLARLDGTKLPVALYPDHHLHPGTILLETGDGWIEDGPQVRLAKLRQSLDAMGLPR